MEGGSRRAELRPLLVALALACGACVSSRGPLPVDEALDSQLRGPRISRALPPPTEPVARALPSVRIDPSNGLSPDEAALVAVAVNPTLRAIRGNRGIAHAQITQAGILPNPTLAGSVDVATDGPGATGSSVAYTTELGWNLSPLISVGTAVEAAQRASESAELDIAWQEWQVAQAARLAAGRLLYIRRRLELATQSERTFRDQVDVLRGALGQGNATVLNLSAAEEALQSATLDRLRVVQEQRVAERELRLALGVPPTARIDVDPSALPPTWEHLPPLPQILEALPSTRLDLRSLQRGYDSQDARVRAATLRAFPPLAVSIRRSQDTSQLGTFGFTVALDLPFFDRNQGEIELEVATKSQLYDEYLARAQSARFEVAEAIDNLTSAREQVELLQAAIPTLQNVVNLASQQVGQGNVSLIDLYDLRVRLLTTQLNVEELLQSEFEIGVALDTAAGRILADPESTR